MLALFKRYSLFFAALFFLLLAFLILTFYAAGDRETPFPQRLLMQISFPLQQKARGVVSWVQRVGEGYFFLIRLREENRELKRLVSGLRQENNRLREAVLAEERLKKLSPVQSEYPSRSIVAQVYGRDPSSWFKTVLVDKGGENEISKDLAVVAADGLVGRVMEVSAHTAKVLLITDPNSAVDVILQRSRSQAIMEGRRDEACILKYVQKSDDVQVGDKVITSGMGGIFPKGILTGTVTKVDRKRQGIFQYVEVTPAVDFSRLEEVLILGEELKDRS
jgi:rod shape-determining protein MreC